MVSARLVPETDLDYDDVSVDDAGLGISLRGGGGEYPDSDEEVTFSDEERMRHLDD